VANTWQHIVAVVDNTAKSIKGYVDGIEVISDTYSGNTTATSTRSQISGWRDDSSNLAIGKLSDVMVWSRTLSVHEIGNLADPAWSVDLGGAIVGRREMLAPAVGVTVVPWHLFHGTAA
jgi:hypothetical protein